MDNIQTANSLERDLAERDDGPPGRLSLWLVNALALAGTILFLVYNVHILLPRIFDAMTLHSQWRYLFYPSLLWLIMGSVLFAFRTAIWMRYRPISPVAPDMAPTVSVIIPAYNEGAMVLRSIQSVAEARFPHDRLEILAVDDGSADDTWAHICTAAARYPGLVTPLRHDRNRGKRAALAWGFERARGEFIVSIDSDSVIDRDALLAIVAPFRDARIGAVAGKVLVYNRRGLIPQMLHARYIMSFDFLRAVESAYRNVFCCPGALTALRASAIRPLVTRWQAQTFLGSPCTIGEDRAMTNYLLEAGFDTVYQGNAVVRTVVPETFSKLCKMLLRWDRSYVREELRFARIVWKRPLKTRAIAIVDRFITNLRYPVSYISLALLLTLTLTDPWTLPRMLVAIGLISTLNMVYFIRSERSFGFLWGVVYAYVAVFGLSWIFPYALATVRKRGWLTR